MPGKKGVGLSYDIGDWSQVQEATGAQWFLNWNFLQARKEEAGQAYVLLYAYDYSVARRQQAAAFAQAWPGSFWLVGNEPNDPHQDAMPAYQAGWCYGVAAEAILEADPTARVYIGGVLNDVDFMWGLLRTFPAELKPLVKGLHWHRYGEGEAAINFMGFRANVNQMVAKTREWGGEWDWRAWLTEFGVIGHGTVGLTEAQVVGFIEAAVPWLEQRNFLQRYAWFCWDKDDERQPFPVRELKDEPYGSAYKEAV